MREKEKYVVAAAAAAGRRLAVCTWWYSHFSSSVQKDTTVGVRYQGRERSSPSVGGRKTSAEKREVCTVMVREESHRF
jgi:hypothetical protein